MKIGPKYRLPFQRKLKRKTDYRKRLKLLYSKKLRLVVRKSSKHMRAQIVEFKTEGDNIPVSASTQDLKKFGWSGSTNNIVSAYLVGLLLGKRAIEKKINSAILDIGMHKNVKGSRIYAVLKGVLDAGLSISHSPDILPAEDRISGKHIVDYGVKLKKKGIKVYKKQFSQTKPEKIPGMFEKVKSKILKG